MPVDVANMRGELRSMARFRPMPQLGRVNGNYAPGLAVGRPIDAAAASSRLS